MKKIILYFMIAFSIIALTACTKTSGGKKLEPLYTAIDFNNPEDGIYYVDFTKENLGKDNDGNITLKFDLYTEDIYDAVDANNVKDGDILVCGGREEKMNKIIWNETHNEFTADVDSWDDWIWALSPNESGGTYYYHGPDDHHSYTKRGSLTLPIDKNCIFTDTSELGDSSDGQVRFIEKKIQYNEIVPYIEKDEYQNFICLNTSVRIESGKIVEINKWYIP